jgi:hypothetical protein
MAAIRWRRTATIRNHCGRDRVARVKAFRKSIKSVGQSEPPVPAIASMVERDCVILLWGRRCFGVGQSARSRWRRWPAIARVKAVRKSIKSVGQSEPSAVHTAGRGGGRPIRRAIDSYPPAVDSGRLSNPITRRPASRFDTTERLSMATASMAIPESRSPAAGRPSMASGRGRVERESIRFRPVDGRRLADCRQVVSQIA